MEQILVNSMRPSGRETIALFTHYPFTNSSHESIDSHTSNIRVIKADLYTYFTNLHAM